MFPKYSAQWWQKMSAPELRDAEGKSAPRMVSAGNREPISLQSREGGSEPQRSLAAGRERELERAD
jgi:hypothetical protein